MSSDLAAEVASLKANVADLRSRLRLAEEAIDTLWTPPWKRLLFWIDGWPLYRMADRPAWRPWRRWWRS